MALITKSNLRALRNEFQSQKGLAAFTQFVNENTTRTKNSSEVSVFLSHKHGEHEELKDAIALLKKYGVNVYIDHYDNEMPKGTCGKTAQLIKQKIRDNQKFVLLATEAAINSKWCNWELGYGDANKWIKNIAVLIVADDDKNWTGHEYLEIYPVIVRKDISFYLYEVVCPDGSKLDLADWLKHP